MSDHPTTSYDELPYADLIFPYTHPANLAMVAELHGLDAPPISRCRVLDLGCGTGANLWPMALALPESEFVGLDLSARQIDRGRETVTALGLTNLTLHARSILDPTADLGTFDYVIAHGVYSWVPPAVQDRIFDVVHRQLSPAGVAYVSFNVHPGWHLRGMVRDMLSFHVAGAEAPPVQIAQARNFLDFLAAALPEQDSAYATILRGEVEVLRAQADYYLFHEYLEADNRPVYFHQFVAHAGAHGLQYLAEATPQPLPGHVKPEVLETLAAVAGDRIRLEQYLDFLRCRIFRRTLLCHAAARPDFGAAAARLPGLAISSEARPEAAAPDDDPSAREQFVTPNKLRFTTNDSILRRALWRLWAARPAAVTFPDLLAAAGGEDTSERLTNGLLQLYLGNIVELHLVPPALAPIAGERPRASPLARLEAARGAAEVHDLRLRIADPDPDQFARYLLPLLDGTRTRADLVDLLAGRAAVGEFAVHDNAGRAVTDPAQVRPALAGWVEGALERLAKVALLSA